MRAAFGVLVVVAAGVFIGTSTAQQTLPSTIQHLYDIIFGEILHKVFASNKTLKEAVLQRRPQSKSDSMDLMFGCASYDSGSNVGE
jgi:hypothetical protein